MRRPTKAKSVKKPPNPAALRVRVTWVLVTCTLLAIPALLMYGERINSLSPGPLASPHSAIAECATCHTAAGLTKLSWIQSLYARDPHADSKACLTCHKIPEATAYNPHASTAKILNDSSLSLQETARATPVPQSAKLRNIAFPMDRVMSQEINCATCHNEHQGTDFNLSRISDAQCQSCHIVQFDKFEGNHPEFSDFPFKRRQRIKFDHGAHFTKHYPEFANKNDASKRIPDTCSACHNSNADKRHMAVVPFVQNCSSCHLDQITGVERATGPKGIAFLSLPGLDLETLKARGAAIGEWPELSEAELSPFMALIFSQKAQGQALVQAVSGLDLLDLSGASDEQINAVANLAWAIKGLFYALLSGKASDVLADLNKATGNNVNSLLVADLSANLPRDVIINAQLEWLPNLADEMLQRRASYEQQGSGWSSSITESKLAATVPPESLKTPSVGLQQIKPAELVEAPEPVEPVKPIRLAQAETGDGESWTIDVFGRLIKGSQGPAEDEPAIYVPAGEDAATGDTAGGGAPDSPPDEIVEEAPADETEVVATEGPDGTEIASAPSSAPRFAPIESSVDAESWAEYGGWYRRDFAILYRPVGHKDKFVYTWLNLTGPLSQNAGTPAAAVFDQLTFKDSQGQCVKCHSVDNNVGRAGRSVNWSPKTLEDKRIRFTKFIHEPHFGVMENEGCLTCHELKKDKDFPKTYIQGDPSIFSGNFAPVKKDLCQTCHKSGAARQDCQTCHEYHVLDVVTPIIRTQLPSQ